MKFLSLSLFASLLMLTSFAQSTAAAIADVDALYAALQKTPSYKAQMKGATKQAFTATYERIREQLAAPMSDHDAYRIMSQLLLPLRDNHLYFYEVPEVELDYHHFNDTAYVQAFRSRPFFQQYPKVNMDLQALESTLTSMPKDSVAGIYFYDGLVKAAVVRTEKSDSLVSIVLDSWFPNWQRGEVLFTLQEHAPNRFYATNGQIIQKTLGLHKNVKFMHQRLTEIGFSKDPKAVDHVNIPGAQPVFGFRRLDPQIDYLRLGTFASFNKALIISDSFYHHIKDSITAQTLIVDIRNNGGGAFKASGKYLQIIKDFSKKGNVYLIVNDATVSNAEEFTIEAMKLKNVTVVGETTNGKLTYGNNYGTAKTLPSGRRALYITDMKGDAEQLSYEESGIEPQIALQTDRDWIEQVVGIIRAGQ